MPSRAFGWMLLAGLAVPLAVTQVAGQARDTARAATLLADARQALGGANRFDGVKTLQVTGTFRRVVGGNDVEGDFDVFIELPDKYLRSEKTGTPGQPSTETIEGLVGTEVRDAVRGGARGGGGGGAGLGAGGDLPVGPPPEAGGADDAARADGGQPANANPVAPGGRGGRGFGPDPDAQRRARQAEVSRLLLMWLLRSDVPLAWVGTAESPDGKADVLEATYADGQPTRLFLEAGTHVPLMMQWQGVQAAPGRGGRGGQRGGGGAPGAARGDGAGRQGGAPPLMTFDMTFADQRAVNGIRLPHVITRATNGQTIERWTITRYRVNPSFNAETFTR